MGPTAFGRAAIAAPHTAQNAMVFVVGRSSYCGLASRGYSSLVSQLRTATKPTSTPIGVLSSRRVQCRTFATENYSNKQPNPQDANAAHQSESESDAATDAASSPKELGSQSATNDSTGPPPYSESEKPPPYTNWEDKPNWDIEEFSELPYSNFGVNQHVIIDREYKECLRRLLWNFRAPIRYAFAYGSGVFPQSKGKGAANEAAIKAVHPNAPLAVQRAQDGHPKMIDFIFGVTHTQHFHSLNLRQHRDHYSALGSLGSGAVAAVQDRWGAGVYFNTYVTLEGISIKYGVVSMDTLERDLRSWDTLYLAGRLHKPVKILRDHAKIRLANQINLLSAVRTALLLLPPTFTEHELYNTIAGISYLGDPRMAFPTENPRKVANIVGHNMGNFRWLYAPLIESLPNVEFDDPVCKEKDWLSKVSNQDSLKLRQDMDPVRRSNMVRRLPKAFRSKLYFEYQKKFQVPQLEFNKMMEESQDEDETSFKRQAGGPFERRIAQDDPEHLHKAVRTVIKKTINWPSTSQSLKGPVTAGWSKTWRYLGEKMAKYREGKDAAAADAAKDEKKSN
jgi:mitochondrial translocator assembly and maintenance protein 41